MSSRRPLHEVIAGRLSNAHKDLVPSEYTRRNEIMYLLGILRESEMPAEAARAIAEDNTGLLALTSGQDTMFAELVADTLSDLQSR